MPPADLDAPVHKRLNFPQDYIFPAFARYLKWGVYPDGRGYDDQLESLLEDFQTLQYQLNYAIQQERRNSGK